jgi:uncharacterized membrane protein
MAILLGLASAIAFGVSDYLAGVLSRRLHFTLVGLISQVSATALAWASLPWTGGPRPATAALAWGALSGIGGGVGSLALYRGLGRGKMSVVGPLSSVGAAALPALAGIALGDRPSPLAIGGVLLALPAIWLVASSSGRPGGERAAGPSGVGDGLLAGAGFGLLFIGLARAGDDAGLWPVATGQLTALVLLTVVVGVRLATTRPALPGGPRALLPPLLVGASASTRRCCTSWPPTPDCSRSSRSSRPSTRASPSCWPGCCSVSGSPGCSGRVSPCARSRSSPSRRRERPPQSPTAR